MRGLLTALFGATPRRGATVAAALAAGLLLASPASATPNFPGAVQSKLGAATSPTCFICHVGRTGLGTVNSPFGSGMRARGLVPYDEAALGVALAAMESERIDSDEDGVIDVEAIRAGQNPNPVAVDDGTTPRYGCISESVAGRGVPSTAGTSYLLVVVGACLLARRRRWRGGAHVLLLGPMVLGGLSACHGSHPGAAQAPRLDSASVPSAGAAPLIMPSPTPTKMEAELRAMGLDPLHLPLFEDLRPRQRRAVMSTFTQALGWRCTDCHATDDFDAPTRAKTVTVRMWNEMTRPYTVAGGGAVYCDSCHQGSSRVLDRRDRRAVVDFMGDAYVLGLAHRDHTPVDCASCHGRPFRADFLASSH